MTETELAFASSRPGLHAQVYCLLQIGYFKAKHAFFRFDWSEVERKPITKHEHYMSAHCAKTVKRCWDAEKTGESEIFVD